MKGPRESRVLPVSDSRGQAEHLHFIGVLPFGDEFREGIAFGGIQEKFRQALAQRVGHHELGGRDAGADGAQPGAEGLPDELRKSDREVLQQSLTDDARLDEDMISVDFAFDGSAVLERLAMQVLIPASALIWGGDPQRAQAAPMWRRIPLEPPAARAF